ncbi:MAG: amino acid adenylation domain-containing protein, partial [bacterium]|nr:amino acid adenylation domain-containing protein [bacterium]
MNKNLSGKRAFAANQYNAEREYWLNKLSGEFERTCFPRDFSSPAAVEKKMDSISFQFPPELFERLSVISNNSDSRLHLLLISGLNLLLYKYTQHTDIVVGTPIDAQKEEGEFLNTVLALRAQIDEEMTVKDLLMQMKQTAIEASAHLNYPIETLPYDLSLPIVDGEFPLFDTVILLQNIHDKEYIKNMSTQVNMIFSFLRTEHHLEGIVEYNTAIFEKSTVERILNHFSHLLDEAFNDAGSKIVDIPLLGEEEVQQWVTEFNGTTADYPRDKMIHQLFEEQVAANPGAIAVETRDKSLSYAQLNSKANQLARLLRGKGIEKDITVAVMMESSAEVLIAVLAVLKAGGTYLPMGFQYPQDRLNYMLEDSGAKFVLTREVLAKEIVLRSPCLYMEDENLYQGEAANLEPLNTVDSLAYIIYTSGTTGNPKGVMVPHQGVVNYIWWAAQTYVRGEKIGFSLYTSISFDLTVTSIFTPLITGNTIYVHGGLDNKLYIEDVVEDERVGIIKLTPSHLKFLKYKEITDIGIKRIIVGGEDLESHLANEIYEKFNRNVEIYNEYGPTETVVGSMIHRFDPDSDTRHSVPIGVPIANTGIYLLNSHQQPVPVGVPGEIYISGDSVTRGYLHNPELSDEKFISNPFNECQKMYKTGDLAIRLANGNLEFRGRVDHQVKIRGYRVETGEIEARILDYQKAINAGSTDRDSSENLNGAVVIDIKDENSEIVLCAYVVSEQGFDPSALREYLGKELPDYMIPTYYNKIDRIPLTPSGKVDRKALPEPNLNFEGDYVAPRDEWEEQLVEVWADVLALEKDEVSIDASFFELGGHSLRATFLAAAINRKFDVKVPLVEIFEKPTIRGLAEYIKDEAVEDIFESIQPIEKKDYYPLSSSQLRIYILRQIDSDSIVYNMPQFIPFNRALSVQKLEETFLKLIDRHESLRTSFHMLDNQPVQKVYDHVDFEIEFESPGNEINSSLNTLVRPFDLSRAPLLRVGLIKRDGDSHMLMVDMHHIISDGISMSVLRMDFVELYGGGVLPPLPLQYKDFSQWQSSESKIGLVRK